MRGMAVAAMMMVSVSFICKAQNDAAEVVMKFSGAESIESLDPCEVERLEEFMENPVRINMEPACRLEETGLLTHYQAVSLEDYRHRHGDVMSFSELSAVDGFTREFVARVAPFISLESYRLPSERADDSRKLSHELILRTGVRSGNVPTYGLKYTLSSGGYLSGSLAFSRTAASKSISPDALSGNVMWNFTKVRAFVIIGDFNARFGQGLSLWNGMSLGSIHAPSSLMKRPSGVSRSNSFNGNYTLRGAAGSISFGKVRISALTDISPDDGLNMLAGMNMAVFFRNGQISMTHYADMSLSSIPRCVDDTKSAVDLAVCLRGIDLFAESAYDWKSSAAAFLGGVVFPAGEDVRVGTMLRTYSPDFSSSRSAAARSLTNCSNEYSISLSAEYSSGRWIDRKGSDDFSASVRRHSGNLSVDAAYFPVPKAGDDTESVQLKLVYDHVMALSDVWTIDVRFAERFRTWNIPFRSEFRADLTYDPGLFSMTLRADVLNAVKWAFLSYLEPCLKTEDLACFLRVGVFRADDWENRIYVYERDAPGNFNVPAYYGRGIWAALAVRWRVSRILKVCFRAAATSYVFMTEEKPGKAELKLHIEIDL